MSTLLIKQHNPLKSVYGKRIDETVWQRHEKQIHEMHGAKFTRTQMLDALAENHAFNPSPGQLNGRIKYWGLKVYKATSAIPTSASTLSVLTESSTNGSSPSTCFSRPQDPDACSPNTSMEDLSALQKSEGPGTKEFTELPAVACDQFADPDMALDNYSLAQAKGPPSNKIGGPVVIARDLPPVWTDEAPAPVHALTFSNPRAYVYTTTTSSRSRSSLKAFQTLAGRLREDHRMSGTANRSDRSYSAMSIDTRESQKFANVTGMPDELHRDNIDTIITVHRADGRPDQQYHDDSLRHYTKRRVQRDEHEDGCRWDCVCEISGPRTGEVQQLKGYHMRR